MKTPPPPRGFATWREALDHDLAEQQREAARDARIARRVGWTLIAVIAALIALAAASSAAQAGARTTGIASHYGPPTEPGGAVACGRGTIPPNVHGIASTVYPCGTRLGICLVALAPCIEARVTDYGPDPALGRDLDLNGFTFAAIAPLSAGLIRVSYRVHTVPRCVPRWVKTYWRPGQGREGRYAPTCGTRYAR